MQVLNCLLITLCMAGLFDIFMLLHIWQNCVCFVDFLPLRKLCAGFDISTSPVAWGYRNFRPFTRTAHYPHRSIFAIKGKSFQQITRTENKRKSCFKSPCLTKLFRQAIELFAWPWIDSMCKSRTLQNKISSVRAITLSLYSKVKLWRAHFKLGILTCGYTYRKWLVARLIGNDWSL